jgi:hypothetical protein
MYVGQSKESCLAILSFCRADNGINGSGSIHCPVVWQHARADASQPWREPPGLKDLNSRPPPWEPVFQLLRRESKAGVNKGHKCLFCSPPSTVLYAYHAGRLLFSEVQGASMAADFSFTGGNLNRFVQSMN